MSTLKNSVQPTLSMYSQFAAGATVESCSLTRYTTTVQGSPGRLAVCVIREDGPTLTLAEVVYDNGTEYESAPNPYATGSAA